MESQGKLYFARQVTLCPYLAIRSKITQVVVNARRLEGCAVKGIEQIHAEFEVPDLVDVRTLDDAEVLV